MLCSFQWEYTNEVAEKQYTFQMKTCGLNKEGHYFVLEHYIIHSDLWWMHILIFTVDNTGRNIFLISY